MGSPFTRRSGRVAAPAKMANFLPSLRRDQLELALVDVLDATDRFSQDAAEALPCKVGERDDASDARAIDELLADWSAAY